MLLSEMKTALKRYGFDDSDPLTTWLNWAMWEVEKFHDWRFLEFSETVVVAANSPFLPDLTFSTRVRKVNFIKLHDSDEMYDYISSQQMARRNNLSTGTPCEFSLSYSDEHALITVYPTPSASTTVDVSYQLKELKMADGNPNDHPAFIPDELESAIVIRAAVFGLQAESEEDRAATLMTTYLDIVQTSAQRESKTSGPLAVQDVMGYGN